MKSPRSEPTGQERIFGRGEIIVSKTDLAGRITYANRVFLRVAGYEEQEVLGRPHSLIRHPDMPRAVFSLLWETITQGRDMFAYLVNLAKGGDHYWVFAHVTPTLGPHGAITGYHSSRRFADRGPREKAQEVYRLLLEEERKHPNPVEATRAGRALLDRILAEKRMTYDQWVFSL